MPACLSGAGQGGPTFLPGGPKAKKPPAKWPVGCRVSPSLSLGEGVSPQLLSHHREKGQVAQQPPGDKGLLFWMDTPF